MINKILFKEFRIRKQETKILEAICDRGCRNIQSISDATGISYERVEIIINNVNLLEELKKMKENERYEKIKSCYKRGMTDRELEEKIGLSRTTVLAQLKRVKKESEELHSEQKNLSYILTVSPNVINHS